MSDLSEIKKIKIQELEQAFQSGAYRVESIRDAHRRVVARETVVSVGHRGIKSKPVEVSREFSIPRELHRMAQQARVKGDFVGAFKLFLKAAKSGSKSAQFWLGKIDRLEPLEQSKIGNKQSVAVDRKFNIKQSYLLKKFADVLMVLHQKYPEKYSKQMTDLIIKSLSDDKVDNGHCLGFALYFGELSILINPETGQDRTGEYFEIAQKIMNWDGDLFVPPENFSYQIPQTGKESGRLYRDDLLPEEQIRLDFTREITEFIEIIRFQQQYFWEGDSIAPKPGGWFLDAEGQDIQRNELLSQAIDVPTSNQEDLPGIYNRPYFISEEYEVTSKSLPSLLESCMFETNVAQITIRAGLHDYHATTAIYREGHYYYFDPNMTSEEVNYDPRFSACSYDSVDDLVNGIEFHLQKMGYGDKFYVVFTSKDRENFVYPTQEDVESRFKFMQIAKIYDEVKEKGNDLLAGLSKKPPIIDIVNTPLNSDMLKTLVEHFPDLKFMNMSQEELANLHYNWGGQYLALAAEEGHPNAQYYLAFDSFYLSRSDEYVKSRHYETSLHYCDLFLHNTKASQNQIERVRQLRIDINNIGMRALKTAEFSHLTHAFEDAEKAYVLAASAGNPIAQVRLADIYEGHEASEITVAFGHDDEKAFKYRKMVTENPDADPVDRFDAQFDLADMYENGRGVSKNTSKALEYYKLIVDSTLPSDFHMDAMKDIAHKKIQAL
ncbi:MAG: sel1 repeat family protein [Alphaproteobacteria bacterium]|nr:sel1 repeat family protein [Alphaproteobacteria bacterium]MBP9877966.1 sel1 repeat family protein [Alphaproteobacteria bacterium]